MFTIIICCFLIGSRAGKGGIIVKPEWVSARCPIVFWLQQHAITDHTCVCPQIVHSFAQKKRLPLTKYTFEKGTMLSTACNSYVPLLLSLFF